MAKSLKTGTRKGCHLLLLLFNIVLEILATVVKQELTTLAMRKIKIIEIGREEVKLSLFVNGMIPYIGNAIISSQKFLQLIT